MALVLKNMFPWGFVYVWIFEILTDISPNDKRSNLRRGDTLRGTVVDVEHLPSRRRFVGNREVR